MKKLLLLSLAIASFSAQAQFWTVKSTGFAAPSRGIDEIEIVDQNVIWAKAYDGSGTDNPTLKEITRSIDGGNTWTPITVNLGLGTALLGLGSITAVSADVAWVTGHPTTGNTGGVWKTTNGGATWSKQTTAAYTAGSFTNFVHFWDANNGVTMGDPLDGYFEIYTTPDGGTTWTRRPSSAIPAPLDGEWGYTGHFDEAGGTIWFGTNMGRLYRSTDMGMNWTVTQTPLSDFSGPSGGNYTFSDSMKGLMNSAAGNLWSTMDGGVTWTEFTPTGTFGFNDIEYVPGTSSVVSSGSATNTYGSYYSNDDGMTWMVAEADTQFTEIEFLDPMTGFAGGFNTTATEGGIYKYTGTVLAVAQFNNETMTVFPNPSNGAMEITGISVNEVTVFDILGKQVFYNSYSALNNVSLDLTALNAGMYLMTVTNDTGLTKTVKIVKN